MTMNKEDAIRMNTFTMIDKMSRETKRASESELGVYEASKMYIMDIFRKAHSYLSGRRSHSEIIIHALVGVVEDVWLYNSSTKTLPRHKTRMIRAISAANLYLWMVVPMKVFMLSAEPAAREDWQQLYLEEVWPHEAW